MENIQRRAKNARKKKSYHIEGEVDGNDDIEEMLERSIGQKAAKKAALAAKGKSEGSNLDDDGNRRNRQLMWRSLTNFAKSRKT